MADQKKAIVLLSGGLDSATCLAIAKDAGYDVYAMSFIYGQRHRQEILASFTIAETMQVAQHNVVEIDLKVFGGSSLTTSMEVPKNRLDNCEINDDIPNTYVPARNTIFLSYALAWAEVLCCNDIFIGVNSIDYSGYPDCRPEFIEAYEKMANLATKKGVEGNLLSIHTPLLKLTKADIIKKGIALGIDYGMTHSCYDPSKKGLVCGMCDSCVIRRRGFEDAGVEDPTMYQ